jgi:hypothetical protein
VDAAGIDQGNELIEFAVADERIAADDGDVEGFVVVDESQGFRYQFVTSEVGELAELRFAAEVCGIEGIAAGATQGAFFGDFDGEIGGVAGQDSVPGMQDFRRLHGNSAEQNAVGLSKGKR